MDVWNAPTETKIVIMDARESEPLVRNTSVEEMTGLTDNPRRFRLTTSESPLDMTLGQRDLMEMTPLHVAAFFDRKCVAENLINEGADVNKRDSKQRTPLLLAAVRKSWKTMRMLISRGADLHGKDEQGRNIHHIMIINGGKYTEFLVEATDRNPLCLELLNDKDMYGRTPLHYASKVGRLTAVSHLLDMGASPTAKTKYSESPLHFAAEYGQSQTCTKLLDTIGDSSVIDEVNKCGRTPLHLASHNGYTDVVELLLHRGASLLRDREGNTCLHVAAMGGYTDILSIILACRVHPLDLTNDSGDTALHIAAREGHSTAVIELLTMGAKLTKNSLNMTFLDIAIQSENRDVCAAAITHPRWRESLNMSSSLYGNPMLGFIKHVPDVCTMVLDRLCWPCPCDQKSEEFWYKYDFSLLEISAENTRDLQDAGLDHEPLLALNSMVKYRRVDCLTHPLCIEYLRMKWNAYGFCIYVFNVFIYLTFLLSLTTFVVTLPSVHHCDRIHTNTKAATEVIVSMLKPWQKTLGIIIMVLCVLNIIKEVCQLLQLRLKYLRTPHNFLGWILYINSAVFIGPFLMDVSSYFQWQCGAIAVFLAWFKLLLYLQRVEFFGIYVVMFLEMLKTLLQLLAVFIVLIVAFGLSFYTIMAGERSVAFKSPVLSLVTTGVMMLGSIDYLDSWVVPFSEGTPETPEFSTLSFFILIIFILLMPIILMNLLIGLAVGDIESVQRNAGLKRMAMQVELHSEIERKLPQRVLKFVNKDCVKVYPNRRKNLLRKIWGYLTRAGTLEIPRDQDGHIVGSNELLQAEFKKQQERLKDVSLTVEKMHDVMRMLLHNQRSKNEVEAETDNKGTKKNSDRERGIKKCNLMPM